MTFEKETREAIRDYNLAMERAFEIREQRFCDWNGGPSNERKVAFEMAENEYEMVSISNAMMLSERIAEIRKKYGFN